MAHAKQRRYLDADSHLMELPDFLTAHADTELKKRLPEINFDGGGRSSESWREAALSGGHSPEKVAELVALGDDLLSGPKGYFALGAFNKNERTTALNMLGFNQQFVFSTFSAGIAFDSTADDELRYGATRAHNRAMAEFCADDERLIGVALLPLDNPDRAIAEMEAALSMGLGAMWVPHRPAGGRSPGHTDLDPVWALMANAKVPFVLHVGGDPLQIEPDWMNTGRPEPTDWLGGGENVRGKDMIALHQAAETFVGSLVLDGVLQRHPTLRGGVIELGAGWVPALLRRLDLIAEIWKKSEPDLASLNEPPSEQIRRQMAFTPYPFEDVGAMIKESNADLYLFSSDYPHIEGGRNPLGRFESSLHGMSEEVLDKFFEHNMADLLEP
ncbi:MAG: amidohydrolase family protein [Actinomycetota bacterium]|nr:amidohydrolase family protein [Actinomycetota bacterium]MDG1488846.1 amidohydrolase family protein [Actinomycetota bacterium]MDG2121909.1 amidohydrolase family protein [Actinomycetota bacterium]